MPTLLPDRISGLVLANDVANPNTHITVSAGNAWDDTDQESLTLALGLRKHILSTWAIGPDAGGLDIGLAGANLWYYVYLIGNDTTGAIDYLFSGSPLNPAMPFGWTRKIRVGSFLTDASGNIIAFRQTGNYFAFITPPTNLSSFSLGGVAPYTWPVSVPAGEKHEVTLSYYVNSVSAAGLFVIRDPDLGAPQQLHAVGRHGNTSDFPGVGVITIFTDSNTRICLFDTAAVSTITLRTLGYVDGGRPNA